MKKIFMKFIWAFSWLFFGVFVAFENDISEPIHIGILAFGSLILADFVKFSIGKMRDKNPE